MIDLDAWVGEELDPKRRAFRSAVQLVLRSIANSPALGPAMIMKGGVLLAIRYGSGRFTKDIDFSTSDRIQDVDLDAFLTEMSEAIRSVSADNEYGLAIRLQSHEIKPPNNPTMSFPTLKMKVGYADRRIPRQVLRLENDGATDVVQIDYSFNEWISDVELLPLDGGKLAMYPFHDLVAEKFRSVLQQPIRNRERFQDIYDIYLLISCAPEITEEDRQEILRKLIESANSRNVPLSQESMRDASVIELSRRGYEENLRALVSGEVPNFEVAYSKVQELFESLPWQ